MTRLALLGPMLLAVGLAFAAQPGGTLRVTVTVTDSSGTITPVARHALLVSDNPATAAPRRVITGVDGQVEIRLRPGSYTIESDRPVVFAGRPYQWTQTIEVGPGASTLELNAGNADPVDPDSLASSGPGAAQDATFLLRQWQNSLAAIWAPSSRATGFIVDARGLIATARSSIGGAERVAVQLSPTLKVRGEVLPSSPATRDVAIVRVDPGVLASRQPVPLACPPAPGSSLKEEAEVVALTQPLRTLADLTSGAVTAFNPRAIETDLRLSFGGAGGPVFDSAGTLLGLTTVGDQVDQRRADASIVRAGVVCDAVSAARAVLSTSPGPSSEGLPTEPAVRSPSYPPSAAPPVPASASDLPPSLSSASFDVVLLTPATIARAAARADRTGGVSSRDAEAEARIGRVTDFFAWSEYFEDAPAVLTIRVTPRLVEGFWRRLGREAARTQGAMLPPLKGFTSNFARLSAKCGDVEVTPIQPFALEHRLSEKEVVREGLYVFAPDALGPHCDGVTLLVYSEKSAGKPETIAVDRTVLDRVWQDFAPYREGAK